VYDRGNTAVSGMQASEIDWKRIFMDEKVRVFHTGGTFSALSDSCVEVVKGSLKESKKNGTLVSYDLNYRSKLWPSDKAIKITGEIAPFIDIVFGNEEDFQKALGFEVDGLDENLKTLPLDSYKKMAEKVVKKYPNIRIVATTLREVKNGSVNNWSAVAYFNGKYYESRKYENIIIEDRVGGGDGFCSGFIYGLLKGMALEDCVEIGAAHGALLQTTRGDTSMVTMDETMYLAKNGSSRIRR
jgi:2-dehydro-3-deoxygluconokinase